MYIVKYALKLDVTRVHRTLLQVKKHKHTTGLYVYNITCMCPPKKCDRQKCNPI